MSAEPTNAELMAVLRDHRDESRLRDRANTQQFSELSGTVKTLATEFLEIKGRMSKVERDHDGTRSIAIKAGEQGADLRGVVTREVSALQISNAAQNVQIADIKAEVLKQTPQLATLLTESSERKIQVATVVTLIKASPVVFTGIAGLLAGLVWLIAHAH